MQDSKPQDEQFNQIILEKLDSIQKTLVEKEKPFLSIDQASEYLGISKNTLYGYTSKGILPFYKPQNRKIFFRIEDLNQFVLDKKNKRISQDEIEEKAVTRIVSGK